MASKPKTEPEYGRFFADPDLSGYENLVGKCWECNAALIVNRATDLKHTYPSAGVTFRCPKCQVLLRPGGDVANHPVQQFMYDAYEPLLKRRYMQVVLLAAQSMELALVMCAAHVILSDVPPPEQLRADSAYAALLTKFDQSMNRLTLDPLRKVVACLALEPSRPASGLDSQEVIARFKTLREKTPTDVEISRIVDEVLRQAVVHLLAMSDFVKLRNAVVHKGFRPNQEQAEWCMEEIPILTRGLFRGFGVAKGQLVMPPTAG